LPHLLALSGNSPFWQGIDTGMKSSRISVMESFPFAGLPPVFFNWASFTEYYDAMSHSGAIQSIKDLYWHIRPNPSYGTIEVRICDAVTNISEIVGLAALVQCLVVSIDREIDRNQYSFSREEYWIAPENNWIAARDGLEAMIICDPNGNRKKISEDIHELIQRLQPIALDLNCEEELFSLKKMIEEGNGADRQRAIYSQTQSHQAIVMHVMEEFHRHLSQPITV
jgi:carboxylate-amine ligase